MAVKKSEKKKDEAAKPAKPAKAVAKETAPKETAPKKKVAAPKAKKEAAPAAPAPKAEAKPEAKTEAKAPKKAAAPVKLTSSQTEILKKINDAAEGYVVEKKIEQRTIDALLEKKLIKKGGKKDGKPAFLISNVGKKHIAS